MFDWLNEHRSWFVWLAAISAVTIAASALLIPWLVARLPSDYFARETHPAPWADRHPIAQIVLVILKNVVGLVLVALGILMLVLPGQGVLTIIAGTMLVDFPGRHAVVQWIVRRPAVMKALNWVRRRAKRPEFEPVEG